MSLDINILRYKKFFKVASELRVPKKKAAKNIKRLFGKYLLTKNYLCL